MLNFRKVLVSFENVNLDRFLLEMRKMKTFDENGQKVITLRRTGFLLYIRRIFLRLESKVNNILTYPLVLLNLFFWYSENRDIVDENRKIMERT